MIDEGTAAHCRVGPAVRSMSADCCGAFERTPGAADEPGPPATNGSRSTLPATVTPGVHFLGTLRGVVAARGAEPPSAPNSATAAPACAALASGGQASRSSGRCAAPARDKEKGLDDSGHSVNSATGLVGAAPLDYFLGVHVEVKTGHREASLRINHHEPAGVVQ